ncbi:MAG: DUF58 domain-containing protein [Acidimicrobiales bacterium]
MLSARGALLGVGALAMAIAGFVYGVEEFVLLAMSVGVLLVTGSVVVRYRGRVGRRALHVVVRVPAAEVTSRQPTRVEMRVTNHGRRRLPPVLVAEPRRHWTLSHPGMGGRGPAGLDDGPDRRHVARSFRLPELAPGADAALWIPVPTGRRGLLMLSGVGVWCEDPFRLFARRVMVAPPAHVVVYPDAGAESGAVSDAAHRHGQSAEQRAARSSNALSGAELSGLRPYAPGDRLTRLHWPSMARSGDLVVREFVETQAGSLTLLVDVRPAVHSGDSLERTVARAAAVALATLRRGEAVELCTSTGDRVAVDPGAAGRQTVLRALALVGAADPGPAMVRRWGGRPTGGAVWATAGRLDADMVLLTTTAGARQPALPEALRRHATTVVVS